MGLKVLFSRFGQVFALAQMPLVVLVLYALDMSSTNHSLATLETSVSTFAFGDFSRLE